MKSKKKSRRRKRTPNTMAQGEENKGLERLMLSIKQRDDETKKDISKLRSEERGLHAEINGTEDEVSAAQVRMGELEDREITRAEALIHLFEQHKIMSDKLEYLENKSRQNYIRIYSRYQRRKLTLLPRTDHFRRNLHKVQQHRAQ